LAKPKTQFFKRSLLRKRIYQRRRTVSEHSDFSTHYTFPHGVLIPVAFVAEEEEDPPLAYDIIVQCVAGPYKGNSYILHMDFVSRWLHDCL
jgi:hypothetical protein